MFQTKKIHKFFLQKNAIFIPFSQNHSAASEKNPGENATLETILFWSKIRWFPNIIFLRLGLNWSKYIKVYVLLFNNILNRIKCFKNEFYYKMWSLCFRSLCSWFFCRSDSLRFLLFGIFFNVWKVVPETEYPLIYSLANT